MVTIFGFSMAASCFVGVIRTKTYERAVAYSLLTIWFVGMAMVAGISGANAT
jgi:hypothetical protein